MYTTVYVHVWHVRIIYNIYSLHYKECYLNYKLISEMIIVYLLLSFGICIQILFQISNMDELTLVFTWVSSCI